MTTRMFSGFITWNPIVGCRHECRYCWARKMARRQKHRCVECFVFEPHLHRDRLNLNVKGKLVFVCDMGDLWGSWVPDEWIREVLKVCRSRPENHYLFLTKNPRRYHDFLDEFPSQSFLGATIETNRNTRVWSLNAPNVMDRYKSMRDLPSHVNKAVSIEPIMDFDPFFVDMIKELKPAIIWVGYDNYRNNLPEPSLFKTAKLIEELSKTFHVEVKTLRRAWWEGKNLK